MKITGYILAGGQSSRMGTDKGLVLFGDKPLVQYSIDLAKVVCNDIFIGTNNDEYSKFGYNLIHDIVVGKGPIGGLHAALKNTEQDYIFLLSCDIPYGSLNVAKLLIEELSDFEIVVPIWGKGKIEPLFGFYSKTILPIVEQQIKTENFKMIDLLNECNTLFFNIDSATNGSIVFKNFNSPEDVGN